jgi:uncharacterized membrane protein YccC
MNLRIRAARRAARTAVVATSAYVGGRYLLGSVPLAVFATFTGIALTGIANFGGALQGRAVALVTSTAVGVGLVAFGTMVSTSTPAASLAMLLVVTIVAFTAAFGGYFAAGTNAVILFFVVAAGSPAGAVEVPARCAGVALGGSIALLGAFLLWPERPELGTRHKLAQAAAALAGQLEDVARGQTRSATLGLRLSIDSLADRPAAATEAERAELYLLNDLQRVDELARFERPVSSEASTSLSRCAIRLQESAAQLRGGRPAHPRNHGDGHPGPASWGSGAVVASELTMAQLEMASSAALAHAEVLVDPRHLRIIDAVTVKTSPGRLHSPIPRWRARAKANLSLRSVHLQNSLRLGVGLAIARLVVGAIGLEHGFWVTFATLTVIKSNAAHTRANLMGALVGTSLGFVVATCLAWSLGANSDAYLVALPVAMFAAIYTNTAISFLAGQASFTVLIVVLFNLLQPQGWRVGVVRVEDVAVGALVALAVGVAIWPRGATGELADVVADLLDRAGGYFLAAVEWPGAWANEGVHESAPPTRQPALDAAIRAENSFAQYLAEHGGGGTEPAAWAQLLDAANRLWYEGDTLRHMATGGRANACGVETVRQQLSFISATLRGASQQPPREGCVRTETLADGWLAQIDAELRETSATVGLIGGNGLVSEEPS